MWIIISIIHSSRYRLRKEDPLTSLTYSRSLTVTNHWIIPEQLYSDFYRIVVMVSNSSSKTKPAVTKCKTYEDWLKLIKMWRSFTDIPANRQGSRQGSSSSSFTDEALDTVLEINDAEIAKDDGAYAIINRLNKLFKKDSTITKYQTLETFETFRSSSMSIQAFLDQFNKGLCLNQILWHCPIRWYIGVKTAQIN